MPHILHLIKDPANRAALDVIAEQARDSTLRLSVVLLQRAVEPAAPLPGQVYRLRDSASGTGSGHPSITHADLLDLIYAADTVVAW